MLREIVHVKQESGSGRRRWFESEGMDIIVWIAAAGEVEGFQLCYDLGFGEHALTWRAASGFSHHSIDTGDHTPLKNQTPVLQPDGIAPWPEIVRLFDARSETFEPDLRRLIRGKLIERERTSAGAER